MRAKDYEMFLELMKSERDCFFASHFLQFKVPLGSILDDEYKLDFMEHGWKWLGQSGRDLRFYIIEADDMVVERIAWWVWKSFSSRFDPGCTIMQVVDVDNKKIISAKRWVRAEPDPPVDTQPMPTELDPNPIDRLCHTNPRKKRKLQ